MKLKDLQHQSKKSVDGIDFRRVGFLSVALFIILNIRFRFSWVNAFLVFAVLYVLITLLALLQQKIKKKTP